ncbi:MAG: SH3 domain-containing protein [Chloroflexi bacterium]|nr:SH3 domain-containing protein [Chloroflexota bacterium]
MNEDDEHALASLRREQSALQTRLRSLEEQKRLHERLGYSRYYLDMQLRALRGELALCQYRLHHLERTLSQAAKPRAAHKSTPLPRAEEAGRYFLPAMGAFLVSLLALFSAGLLFYQRYWPQPTPVPPTPTVQAALVAPAPTPTPLLVATPQVISVVYAVNQTDGLNVRRTPGTGAPVLRILTKGAVVELAGDQQDADGKLWYRTQDGGWLAAELVQVYNTRAEAEEAAGALQR